MPKSRKLGLVPSLPSTSFEPATKTVQDFVNYYRGNQLELSPPFQRQSVWSDRDRGRLIDSILNNYPLPSIFLYERIDGGQLVYDVIDGKQRIESILRFMGEMRGRFVAEVQWPGAEGRTRVDWSDIRNIQLESRLLGYRIPTHIVRSDLGEIIELFVRINSTGRALTSAEKRHARYYNNPFLRRAGSVADRLRPLLVKNDVFSAGQISRMKHVELACELMLSSHRGDVLNKKAAVDRVMESDDLTDRQVQRAALQTLRAVTRLFRMFPQIRHTRFKQVSDFYSLAVLLMKFETEGLILTDKRRNRLAADLLVGLGNGIDEFRLSHKKLIGARPGQELARSYLLTVLEGTDTENQRRARESLLRGVLASLFARKDKERLFTAEQRRLIWNTTTERKCTTCGKILTWDDFTIDHVLPHSKGGRTVRANAALMCRKHNSVKGNRRSKAA
jgi:Protein of unknown function DUF262/HNH endonuclease